MMTYETMLRPSNIQNYYIDLQGYGLQDKGFKWVFKVSPIAGNHVKIKAMLKRKSIFQPSLMTSVLNVDNNNDDAVLVIKDSLDRMLSTEHVRKILAIGK